MKKNNNLKKLVLTTIALLLLCNISSLAFGTNKSIETHIMPLSQQNVVHVNDDFPEENETWFKTIQGGVDHVNTSGTVIVHSGEYNESVIIKKAVRIIGDYEYPGYGNDSYPPIVYDPSVVFIIIGNNAKGTTISHFNITGGTVAGILVLSSRSINISYNNISLNKRGIYLISSPLCNITRNNVINNTYMGISLENADRCKILGNWVVNNKASGIDLAFSNFANISCNHMAMALNGNYSIWIGVSTGLNEITRNNIIDNETTFKPFWHRRFSDSKNLWNNNYWSDRNPLSLWYFVRGTYVIGYSRWIPWLQVDTAAETIEWPYTPNEI
jgi:parallel beta-helix repeat protein